MKSLLSVKAVLFLPLAFASLYSCKKESFVTPPVGVSAVTQPKVYKDEFVGSYSFSKAHINIFTPNALDVFYRASAYGSSTAIPGSRMLCNFFTTTAEGISTCSGYAITKADLVNANIDFSPVPEYVNQIVYDNDGNSIWFQIAYLSIETSDNIRHFSGLSNIVGGTGAFANASGSTKINGHMNAQNPDDFYMKNEGDIQY